LVFNQCGFTFARPLLLSAAQMTLIERLFTVLVFSSFLFAASAKALPPGDELDNSPIFHGPLCADLLVAGARDGSALLRKFPTGNNRVMAAFSHSDQRLAVLDGNRIREFDLKTDIENEFRDPLSGELVSGKVVGLTYSVDDVLTVVAYSTEQNRFEVVSRSAGPVFISKATGVFAISDDGSTAAFVVNRNDVEFCDLKQLKCTAPVHHPALRKSNWEIQSVDVSPDGKAAVLLADTSLWLATNDGQGGFLTLLAETFNPEAPLIINIAGLRGKIVVGDLIPPQVLIFDTQKFRQSRRFLDRSRSAFDVSDVVDSDEALELSVEEIKLALGRTESSIDPLAISSSGSLAAFATGDAVTIRKASGRRDLSGPEDSVIRERLAEFPLLAEKIIRIKKDPAVPYRLKLLLRLGLVDYDLHFSRMPLPLKVLGNGARSEWCDPASAKYFVRALNGFGPSQESASASAYSLCRRDQVFIGEAPDHQVLDLFGGIAALVVSRMIETRLERWEKNLSSSHLVRSAWSDSGVYIIDAEFHHVLTARYVGEIQIEALASLFPTYIPRWPAQYDRTFSVLVPELTARFVSYLNADVRNPRVAAFRDNSLYDIFMLDLTVQ
jgi:hypothetical protein